MSYVYQDRSVEYDLETRQMYEIADRIPLNERDQFFERIQGRIAMIRAGVTRVPDYVQNTIQNFCSELRVRDDLETGKRIIEHYHPQTAWQKIGGGDWRFHDNGQPYSPEAMVALLREGDMQRMGHKEYLRRKHEASEQTIKANEKKSDDKVLAAVDGLSRKQVEQFIAVSTAINTGEKVIAHGEDEKYLERTYRQSQKELAALGPDVKTVLANERKSALRIGRTSQIKKRSKS